MFSGHPKSLAAAGGALALLGIAAPTAGAADTFSSYTSRQSVFGDIRIMLEAKQDKVNDVKFTRVGDKIVVKDGPNGAGTKTGSGCVRLYNPITGQPANGRVECPAADVKYLSVDLGSKNDRVVNSTDLPTYFEAGPGDDVLTGGTGDDTLNGDAGNDGLTGGVGNDGLRGQAGNDGLTGGAGDDVLYGYEGDDKLSGGSGADLVEGNAGADDLRGGTDLPTANRAFAGDGVRLGGQPVDTAGYNSEVGPVTVTLDDQPNDGAAAEGDNVHTDIERLVGTFKDDRLSGSATKAIELLGSRGDDKLESGFRNDTLYGGADQDELRAGPGADRLFGDEGDDTLVGGDGSDSLDGGRGADTMRGSDGIDTVTYAARTAPVSVDFDGAADDGEAGESDNAGVDVENAIGGTAADTLTGDARVNALTGGAGNDQIIGGEGADSLAGGDGDDTITSRDGSADAVSCGAGTDTVIADATDTVAADCENVQLPQVVQPNQNNPTTTTTTPTTKACPAIRIGKGRIKVSKGGAVVRITATGGVSCLARVTLTAGRKSGKAKATLVPGRAVSVRVKLPSAARTQIARKGSVKAKVSVKTVDASGRALVKSGSLRIAR